MVGLTVCCFCHGPILPVNPSKGTWNHVASGVKGHDAKPAPTGKEGEVVKIRFTASRLAIVDDALKTLRRKYWIGPHTVMNLGEGFSVEIAVYATDATDALKTGYESGLDRTGYTRTSPRALIQESENGTSALGADTGGAAGNRLAMHRVPRTKSTPVPSAVGGADKYATIKSWWRCPNCKRYIKAGEESHYAKYEKCKAAAK